MSRFPVANPRYELKYDERAWFNPWDVVEVRIEGIGYKHYERVRSFQNNADALSYCNRLNGVSDKPKEREFKPRSGFYR